MSISPVHPNPDCIKCHGTGRVYVRPGLGINARPCGRCKARECPACDAVRPAHEKGCPRAAVVACCGCSTTLSTFTGVLSPSGLCAMCRAQRYDALAAESATLRAIVADLAAADPVTRHRIETYEDDFCTLCEGARPPQPWPDGIDPPPVVHAPHCLAERAKAAVAT